MGIFDKAKDLIGEHNEKIDQAIDKAGDLIDQKTGGAHGAKIDQGSETLKGHLDRLGGTPDATDTPTTDAPDAPTSPAPTSTAPTTATPTPATPTPDGPPANEPAAGPPVS